MIVAGSFARSFAFGRAVVASPPAACDPYFDSVKFLLHCDGSNGSTTFTDNSTFNRTVTAAGGANISTSDPKFGTGASAYSLNTDAIQIPQLSGDLQPGTQAFTYECWVKSNVINGQGSLGGMWAAGGGSGSVFIVYYTGSLIELYEGTTGVTLICSGSANLSTVWNHVAVTRESNTFRIFVNGTQVATGTSSVNLSFGAGNTRTFDIGTFGGNTGLSGQVDEVRYTVGVARYTSNFTPPTEAFPDSLCTSTDPYYSSVALLLHCDGANGSTSFVDNSPTPKTITPSGNAQITTSVVKYGSGSYIGDGNGDYLTASITGGLGAGSFTIEYWQYLINTSGFVLNSRTSGTGSDGIDLSASAGVQTAFQQILGDYGSMPLNSWIHVAIVRDGSTWYRFFNGILNTTTTNSNNFTGTDFKIGGSPHGNIGYMNGYLDDLRITPGVARYTSNFTPPAGPYPNS